MTLRLAYIGKGVDTVFRAGHRPRDLEWYHRLDEPEVIQKLFGYTVRITWNPDNNRFYVEQLSWRDDWITIVTRSATSKGWDNAKYTARQLARGR